MHMPPLPLTRDIVLIGGGHAHALVLRNWGMNPLPGVRLTVINPGPTAPYTGMLPGFVAGHYGRDTLEIDLMRLARFAGARIILGMAEAMDTTEKTVTITGRGQIAYDVASIDIGIHSDMPALPGFDDHAIPAKPLGRFATAWAAHLDRLRQEPGLAASGLAVIGAGVAGVELAMAMAHGARKAAGQAVPVRAVDSADALRGIGRGAARALRQRLDTMGVTLHERTEVKRITNVGIVLEGDTVLPAGFVVGAAGAKPHAWLAETGLALHEGFVRVDDSLRSVGDASVFAVGDCAHMDHAPRPKAGVFAVRQAPVLAANLRAAVGGGAFRRYRPQRDYLKLISTGDRSAVADKFGLRLEGALLWRWKDRIDRAFMEKLADLPAMTAPKLPSPRADGVDEALAGGKPMCGGCGSKLGRDTLAQALAALPPRSRADVSTTPMDDAAVLTMNGQNQVISTDHLRAMVDDPHVMARIAANHALGDVFAMGATAQAALATIILPRASASLHQRMMAEIMAGADAVMAEAGASIVGGHTLIGDALSIGFTVTGLAQNPVRLSGAQPGDALILTKPIGTGVIMAADMALGARGPWVAGAIAAMTQSQFGAAQMLSAAHAMTDVTGFGLAGHLMGICDAAGLAARLNLSGIPLLEGALALSQSGHRSTLYASNATLAARMTMDGDAPLAALLFDPQTAGGLLAAVAPETAEKVVRNLRESGFHAARIGEMTEGAPHISLR
ncbi:selenide, water dikinase SelD [Oceaniglobus trochenteri]|uniref:selenide, water dikinase SelD n=1 Tax=Oceaniglobus trochenteri TaxID=2763260 RepID=UPI001CFF6C7C|nr:selenide, water dikinase SelD [Oceaniglobus trochenteri]